MVIEAVLLVVLMVRHVALKRQLKGLMPIPQLHQKESTPVKADVKRIQVSPTGLLGVCHKPRTLNLATNAEYASVEDCLNTPRLADVSSRRSWPLGATTAVNRGYEPAVPVRIRSGVQAHAEAAQQSTPTACRNDSTAEDKCRNDTTAEDKCRNDSTAEDKCRNDTTAEDKCRNDSTAEDKCQNGSTARDKCNVQEHARDEQPMNDENISVSISLSSSKPFQDSGMPLTGDSYPALSDTSSEIADVNSDLADFGMASYAQVAPQKEKGKLSPVPPSLPDEFDDHVAAAKRTMSRKPSYFSLTDDCDYLVAMDTANGVADDSRRTSESTSGCSDRQTVVESNSPEPLDEQPTPCICAQDAADRKPQVAQNDICGGYEAMQPYAERFLTQENGANSAATTRLFMRPMENLDNKTEDGQCSLSSRDPDYELMVINPHYQSSTELNTTSTTDHRLHVLVGSQLRKPLPRPMALQAGVKQDATSMEAKTQHHDGCHDIRDRGHVIYQEIPIKGIDSFHNSEFNSDISRPDASLSAACRTTSTLARLTLRPVPPAPPAGDVQAVNHPTLRPGRVSTGQSSPYSIVCLPSLPARSLSHKGKPSPPPIRQRKSSLPTGHLTLFHNPRPDVTQKRKKKARLSSCRSLGHIPTFAEETPGLEEAAMPTGPVLLASDATELGHETGLLVSS